MENLIAQLPGGLETDFVQAVALAAAAAVEGPPLQLHAVVEIARNPTPMGDGTYRVAGDTSSNSRPSG